MAHPTEQHHTCSHGGFPDRPLQKLLASHVQHGLLEQHPCATTAVQWQWSQMALCHLCEMELHEAKRKNREVMQRCLAAPAEFSKDTCMSLGTQPDSSNQGILVKVAGDRVIWVSLCKVQRWEQRKAFGEFPSEILPEKYFKLCFSKNQSCSVCEVPMAWVSFRSSELVVSSQ